MPEYAELVSSTLIARNWFQSVKSKPNYQDLKLQDIYVDATQKERDAESALENDASANPNILAGLPYALQPNSKIRRGPKSAQAPVYPPTIAGPIIEAHLTLKDIHFNPRNIIIEMVSKANGPLWLQIQLLLHTSLQVYNTAQWNNSIAKVSSKDRGFKVGMALMFGEWIIALLTYDNMFKPIYATTRSDLPAQHIDIYADFSRFVTSAVTWAACSLHSQKYADSCSDSAIDVTLPKKIAKRDRLAVHAIRSNPYIWGGIGVYTIVEIFFRAGLSLWITEAELFDVPSRFARLLEAFYSHAANAHVNMWRFIVPHLKENFFLAVSNKERLRYMDWLYLHGKQRIFMSSRMKDQYDGFFTWLEDANTRPMFARLPASGLYDVFEPTYLAESLAKPQNLFHLIFGFKKGVQDETITSAWTDSPLDHYFLKRGISTDVDCTTYLQPRSYFDPLMLDVSAMKATWVSTLLYDTSDKSMWCLLPPFPSNSRPPNSPNVAKPRVHKATLVTGSKRDHQTFAHIVNHTHLWAVGPLDFCGVAHIIEGSIILCYKDPSASHHLANRLQRQYERRTLIKPGQRKAARKEKPPKKSKSALGKRQRDIVNDENINSDDTVVASSDADDDSATVVPSSDDASPDAVAVLRHCTNTVVAQPPAVKRRRKLAQGIPLGFLDYY